MKSIELQDSLLVLKDELYVDRLSGFSFRTKYDSLKKEVSDIESQIRQLNEGLDSLNRLLQRFVMFNLFPNSFLLGQFLHSFIFSFRGSLLFHLSLFAVCSIIISSFWATRLMFLAILSGGFIIFCHHYHHYDVFFSLKIERSFDIFLESLILTSEYCLDNFDRTNLFLF